MSCYLFNRFYLGDYNDSGKPLEVREIYESKRSIWNGKSVYDSAYQEIL